MREREGCNCAGFRAVNFDQSSHLEPATSNAERRLKQARNIATHGADTTLIDRGFPRPTGSLLVGGWLAPPALKEAWMNNVVRKNYT